jgi:hypothetical protein
LKREIFISGEQIGGFQRLQNRSSGRLLERGGYKRATGGSPVEMEPFVDYGIGNIKLHK